MTPEILTVGLGTRAYDIVIGEGVLENAGAYLRGLLKRDRVVVIADEVAWAAQGARLRAGLSACGVAAETIALPSGEATKSISRLEWLLGQLVGLEVDRSDLIVAFGGGVTGDIAGFAAAVLKRGCRFVQVPTTLLAQVDSSVGGKTAVNLAQGKNLVGAFHQPVLVLSDVGALETLPLREIRAGYAEIVKYGALGDADFFAWLEAHGAGLLGGDRTARAQAVKVSCAMKAAIVERDERETGERALLNLGHTFGHALEARLGYSDALLHGEAVAAGMGLAFDYSASEGLCPAEDAERLKRHLRAAGLPASINDIPALADASADDLVALMRHDKKVSAGRMTLILARRIGEAFIAEGASEASLKKFLAAKLSKPKS